MSNMHFKKAEKERTIMILITRLSLILIPDANLSFYLFFICKTAAALHLLPDLFCQII